MRSFRAGAAATSALLIALLSVSAGPAAATSTSPFSTYGGDCFPTDGSGQTELVQVTKLTAKEGLTPLFVSGHRVLVPYSARYSLQGGVGGLKSRHAGFQGVPVSRPGPPPVHSTTCEFTGQVVDEGELIDFTATVIGVMHGPHLRPVGCKLH